jgi:nicotinate-nucleotide pyrophosphorylase (carboxylating)
MDFSPAERDACRHLVDLALAEDLRGPTGQTADLTCSAVVPPGLTGRAALVARRAGVIAGLPAVEIVCASVGSKLECEALVNDGAAVEPGRKLAIITGPLHSLLIAERTALNFIQHLSGVATLTSRYVAAIAPLPCRILDTRKTIPAWRLLEKYAVRAGGGFNHRMGLYDAVLIKDNHLAATGRQGNVALAVEEARRGVGGTVAVEVEVESLQQLCQALPARPDIIMLDNMSLDDTRAAVACRNQVAPTVLLEASGGVTLETVRAIAETGVDRISVGALTHSAPALDIAMDYLLP